MPRIGQGRAGQGGAEQGRAGQGRARQNTWDRRIMWGFATNKAKMFRDDTNTGQFRQQLTGLHKTVTADAFIFLAKPMLTMR